jgi:pantoate--beta-alanine ligase
MSPGLPPENNDRTPSGIAKILVFKLINQLDAWLEDQRKAGKSIGFVPTMGALHEGHTSLIDKAREENDIVVVSIFVNPTQFNNPADLKNYPKTPEVDESLLIESQADVLFAPDVSEMYTQNDPQTVTLDIGSLGTLMEGEHRPGHFAGVIQIVSKLFDLVKPDRAYFGEKDFQQLAVIRFMTGRLNYRIEIVACPTIRESSGLAMSSRNLRLSDKGRTEAARIYQALLTAKAQWKKFLPVLLKNHIRDMIESDGYLKVEYVEIADEITLRSVNTWDEFPHCRIFAAVYCEDVRLIDNVRLF